MRFRQISAHGHRWAPLAGAANLRKALDQHGAAMKKLVHDLRNPINSILLSAQLLEETTPDPEAARLARRIQSQCLELAGMVDRAAAQVAD